MISLSVARSGDPPIAAVIVLSHRGRSPWRDSPRLSTPALPSLAIMLRITRGPEADHARMQRRPLDSCEPAVRFPEPHPVTNGDAGDAFGRKEQLAQVFPAPPVAEIAGAPRAGAGRSG